MANTIADMSLGKAALIAGLGYLIVFVIVISGFIENQPSDNPALLLSYSV